MHVYSPYFQTVHDEPAPYGTLGRGTHYSVFRAAVWHNQDLVLQKESALVLTFAIIWDEDHDTRVIEAAERLYLNGLLPAAMFIGERKGMFNFLTPADSALHCDSSRWQKLKRDVEETTHGIGGDEWPVQVHRYPEEVYNIINADETKVRVYLENIKNLWQLGVSRPAVAIPLQASPDERITTTVRQKYALT